MSKYGTFSESKREFIINRPDTPRPWINYLCNRDGRYVSLLSANAGGYSFIGCPKDGRITRWRYNSLPDDRPGRYLYVKSLEDNDFWTLSWQPTAKPVEHYRVTHGLGYTTFACDYHEVEAEATYFVPLDDSLEMWQVSLRNTADKTQHLELYPFAEMCLGHALIDLINKPNDQHFNRLWFREDVNALFSTKTYWVTGDSANIQENKSWDKVAFMASSLPVAAYAGEREVFFGPYRAEHNPVAVEPGTLQSAAVSCGNLVSCLRHSITFAPGESLEFHILLGVADKKEG
ncbi:MAG: glycosyl transferase family 36, partial [Candidatus Pacebacteria bacterium]|nr:glycosyl transferase family 36 [Candidatus Paceibacterota bacterium]